MGWLISPLHGTTGDDGDDLRRPATGGLYHGLHPGVRDVAGRFGEDLPEWLRRLRGRERQILGRRRLPRVINIEA